jgi:hypothetical protein
LYRAFQTFLLGAWLDKLKDIRKQEQELSARSLMLSNLSMVYHHYYMRRLFHTIRMAGMFKPLCWNINQLSTDGSYSGFTAEFGTELRNTTCKLRKFLFKTKLSVGYEVFNYGSAAEYIKFSIHRYSNCICVILAVGSATEEGLLDRIKWIGLTKFRDRYSASSHVEMTQLLIDNIEKIKPRLIANG